MAYNFQIELMKDQEGGFQRGGAKDSLDIEFQARFQVLVTATGGDDPRDLGPFDIMTRPELPVVNASIYRTTTGLIYPFLTCTSKRAVQDTGNAGKWIVTTQYRTGDRANQSEGDPIPIPDSVANYPAREEIQLGEDERVIYEDKDVKTILLPTGHYYSEPALEKLATQIIRITQYEASIDYDTMQSRKFKLNNATYRTKGPNFWMILDVEKNDVTIPIENPPGTITETPAAEVIYTIGLSARPDGWKTDFAQIDTHYLEQASDLTTKKPFIDPEFKTYTTGLIDKVTGEALPNQDSGPIEFEFYRLQDAISFSFLKV